MGRREMKRYNVWDECESLTGDMVYFADYEADVKRLKENDLIQEEEIIKLIKQNREMLNELKILRDIMKEYDGWKDLAENTNDVIEKVEGEQNDNT